MHFSHTRKDTLTHTLSYTQYTYSYNETKKGKWHCIRYFCEPIQVRKYSIHVFYIILGSNLSNIASL